jgi:DNA-binding response OmpR family regulator
MTGLPRAIGRVMDTLLIIEDEQTVRESLALSFAAEGYSVITAADGVEGLQLARERRPDLIVLDLMLPLMDGLSVCRVLRKESDVRIVIVTARDMEMDRITGLDTGADDYVVKPFSTGELLARVRAVMRRKPTTRTDVLESDDLQLDLLARRATLREAEIELTQKEFNLLAELMRYRGVVLSRDLLLERVWGYDYLGESRTVDVHIRWLREKIEADASSPQRIVTIRGVGYRFDG